jgi:hypothetical protein
VTTRESSETRDGFAGNVDIQIQPDGLRLHVLVRDSGRWASAASEDGHRGFGSNIMRRLTHDFTRTTGPDGASVSFWVPTGGGR